MVATFDLDRSRLPGVREFLVAHPGRSVAFLFLVLITGQALGFLLLGTGRGGQAASESLMVAANVLAIVCAMRAFRRSPGTTAVFWFLFAIALTVLLVPTVLQTYDTLFDQSIFSESTRSLLYCLYGAPVIMMLFLPESDRRGQVKSEIFLDFFQVAITVSLVYSTFFFLPVRRMMPADALLRDISISDAQSLLLLVAVALRLQFARVPSTRNLLVRLASFLLVCAVATFVGDWLYLHYVPSITVWFDLGWTLPQVAAAFIALTWMPSPEPPLHPAPVNFLSFLGANVVLTAMLSCLILLRERWKQAQGETITDIAIAASLLAFTLRLALTQYRQQIEIAQRQEAQRQVAATHEKVGRLLDDARRQTTEITQISELGSLLQACASRDEILRLLPERLRRLFSGASGCVALFSSSKSRLEAAAKWGIFPANQIFAPEDCWALRRGCVHAHSGGPSDPRCRHLPGEGPSVCIPLIANGDSIGVFTTQNDELFSNLSDNDMDAESLAFARRRHLASSVAEHLALALGNMALRESLRLQAIRDQLTGLYNRRYMQEFLSRELYSARRKHRSVAVMMLDLDHFKRYNDNLGHSAGDKALAAIGEILLRSVRSEDMACRYGGEDFVLILPECSLRQATARAEEIRERLQEYNAQPGGAAGALTISVGVAAFDETTDRTDLLLKFAGDALDSAKRAGGDRVVAARPAVALLEADFAEAPSAIEAD